MTLQGDLIDYLFVRVDVMGHKRKYVPKVFLAVESLIKMKIDCQVTIRYNTRLLIRRFGRTREVASDLY